MSNQNKKNSSVNKKGSANVRSRSTSLPIVEEPNKADDTNLLVQPIAEGSAQRQYDAEKIQDVKERYKNIRLPSKYQNNVQKEATIIACGEEYRNKKTKEHPNNDNDLSSAENQKLIQQISELRKKCSQLERRNEEIAKHSETIANEINRLRDDNEFLAGVNLDFGRENDELKSENAELKNQLDKYRKHQKSPGSDNGSNEDRSVKRLKKSKKGKKPLRHTDDKSSESSVKGEPEPPKPPEPREREARIEMKAILKTIKSNKDLDYNETFNSPRNIEIRRKLIPELKNSMTPTYRPTIEQLTRWLGCLHKSRRTQSKLKRTGKIHEDSRRVHCNSRMQDKKIRRIRAARALYRVKDERLTDFDKRQLLKILANRSYHSPEISETDEENEDKTEICVYDYSWRSEELKNLFRNVLDPHAESIQTAKLQRRRRYDDELQHYDCIHPEDAPQWTYIEQEDMIFDMEIDRERQEEESEGEDEIEEVLLDSRERTPDKPVTVTPAVSDDELVMDDK